MKKTKALPSPLYARDGVAKKIFTYLFLIIGVVFTLFPIYWMVITAVKPPGEVLSIPPTFWPSEFRFSNIVDAMQLLPFGRFFFNSAVTTVAAVIITVIINLLAGFAFAKYEFRGKKLCFLIVLSTLMIPMQITMVPNFRIMAALGWINTFVGLIVPKCAEAFGLFLSRQFISEIPTELMEAGRIDGAGEFRIFLRIILPNVKSLISVLIIYTFMWRWNDFLWNLIMTNDRNYFTVQIGLNLLRGLYYINWSDLMGASLVSILPIVVVFFIFQKHFVQGIATTGIKG